MVKGADVSADGSTPAHSGGALRRLRRGHEQAVLSTLARPGGASRAELAAATGLTRTTLYAIITDLMRSGAVVETPSSPTSGVRGRPESRLGINPHAGVYAGVDIRARSARVAFVNAAHSVIATATTTLPAARGARRADRVASLITSTARDHSLQADALRGIGIGITGFVGINQQSDRPEDPATSQYTNLIDHLRQQFDVPVAAANNTRLAALGELVWGAARGRSDIVYIRVGDGIGGGVVINGVLLDGARGAAAELGHLTVRPDGPACYCGGHGCLEQIASIPALIAECQAKGLQVEAAEELSAAVTHGNRVAERVVHTGVARVGVALAQTCAIIDPEVVVIGGPITTLGDWVLASVAEALRRHYVSSLRTPPRVLEAELGEDGGTLGAVEYLRVRHGFTAASSLTAAADAVAAHAISQRRPQP